MRALEDSDIEHRGPVVFSRTAAVVLLVAILSGSFLALVVHSHSRSFVPALLLIVASVAGTMAGGRIWRRRDEVGDSSAVESDKRLDSEVLEGLGQFSEASPSLIGVIELDERGITHLYDNPAASRFFTVESEVSHSNGGATPSPQAIETLLREQCLESKARNAAVRFEFQTIRAGQRRWFIATVFPLRLRGAGHLRFAYLADNITAAKENESALVEARERLAAALEAGSLATWDWDVQRDLVYGDSALVGLYGVQTEYIKGAPASKFFEHIHPEDRERIRAKINVTLETGNPYTEEYRVIGRGGVVRWVSATGRVILDGSGRPARFPGVAVDITHLKEIESALQKTTTLSRNQLHELESVYTYAPVGLGVIDNDRRWMRVNKVMAEYFGRPPTDFIGKPVHEVLPTIADGFDRHLQDSIESRRAVLNVEVSGECPITPGSIRTWSTNFYPLINGDERLAGINVVTEDVTEDKRAIVEHLAHRTILDMVSRQEALEVVLSRLTVAVEGIFPGAKSYILKVDEVTHEIEPLPQAESATLKAIFSPPLSSSDLTMVSKVIARREELIIPDITTSSEGGFIARVRQAGMRSCWIKPIVLTDGSVWGACVIHHPTIRQNPTQGERDHLEVLVRLAATVIERRAFLDRLTTTTERLQYAERAGRIGVFDWNPQTGRVVWTPQLEESFGLAPGTFEGNYEGWRKRVHPDDVGLVTDHFARLMARRERHFKHEYRILHASGEVRWSSDQGEFSYNEAGQAVRIVGVAIDTTERKRLEEQRRRDQERLNLALEGGNLGFWDWNIVTGEVQFGGSWASMLGYEFDEIDPHVRAWEKLIHPDDKAEVEQKLARHLAGETAVYEAEHRLRTKAGQWIWILDRGRVVERDADGKATRAVGIHADINQQRMIRERLNSEAKRKDEFIATLAHELRNPLAPLRTGLEILKRDPAGRPATQAREMMNRQLSHMVRLIEDLLDVSRISLGKLELRVERITLQSVIESALEHSRPAIDAAKHELVLRLPEEEVFLMGDLARLSQVVANLLVNAAKYTPPAGTITIEAEVNAAQASICVRDTGIGIPAEKLSEIFEMFSQVSSPLDRTQGGLGIGLALVRRLVQMHGGSVHAESQGPGRGSSFTVSLPCEEMRQSPRAVTRGTGAEELGVV
jgi:PAS domain S-box-containing protein